MDENSVRNEGTREKKWKIRWLTVTKKEERVQRNVLFDDDWYSFYVKIMAENEKCSPFSNLKK